MQPCPARSHTQPVPERSPREQHQPLLRTRTRTMINFLLLLNLLLVLQTSDLIRSSSFRITSSSPFDKGSKPEKIETKGYLFQDAFAREAKYAYKEVLQRLEKEAKDMCANAVMEFTWKSYKGNRVTTIQGSGTAVHLCTSAPVRHNALETKSKNGWHESP